MTKDATTKWKTVKVREEDYLLIGALREEIRRNGVSQLSPKVQQSLSGVSAGSVIGAALEMFKDHLQEVRAQDWAEKRGHITKPKRAKRS